MKSNQILYLSTIHALVVHNPQGSKYSKIYYTKNSGEKKSAKNFGGGYFFSPSINVSRSALSIRINLPPSLIALRFPRLT